MDATVFGDGSQVATGRRKMAGRRITRKSGTPELRPIAVRSGTGLDSLASSDFAPRRAGPRGGRKRRRRLPEAQTSRRAAAAISEGRTEAGR